MVINNNNRERFEISHISGARYVLENSFRIPISASKTFNFFQDPRNLDKITPPFLYFRPREKRAAGCLAMREGLEINYKMRLHFFPVSWASRISVWQPPYRFVDEQIRGPFAFWRHTHNFTPVGRGSTLVEDRVDYEIPFGLIGKLANFLFVKRYLERIFSYRNKRIHEILLKTKSF